MSNKVTVIRPLFELLGRIQKTRTGFPAILDLFTKNKKETISSREVD